MHYRAIQLYIPLTLTIVEIIKIKLKEKRRNTSSESVCLKCFRCSEVTRSHHYIHSQHAANIVINKTTTPVQNPDYHLWFQTNQVIQSRVFRSPCATIRSTSLDHFCFLSHSVQGLYNPPTLE